MADGPRYKHHDGSGAIYMACKVCSQCLFSRVPSFILVSFVRSFTMHFQLQKMQQQHEMARKESTSTAIFKDLRVYINGHVVFATNYGWRCVLIFALFRGLMLIIYFFWFDNLICLVCLILHVCVIPGEATQPQGNVAERTSDHPSPTSRKNDAHYCIGVGSHTIVISRKNCHV